METRSRIVFSFYIKRSKPLKSGEVPIYARIKVGDYREELAVLRNINPDCWSKEKNGASGNSKEARELNDYLKFVQNQFQLHLQKLRDEGHEITAKAIKNSYLGINTDEKLLVKLFEEHNAATKLLEGKDYAHATVQRYETCLSHLKSYLIYRYKIIDVPVCKLNPDFIRGFELYLKSNRNCCHNTTMKYIKNFKKIVRNALINGWIKSDPFANIKLALKKVDKGFLTEEELITIINKNYEIERLQHVRDVFVFGCFTGLAYSDLKMLTSQHVVKGGDDRYWIHTKRIKTDNESHIPLLPAAMKIIEKYRNNPYCIANNVLLPVYSNQKMNGYLKEIADTCGITKKLTSHIARHTFATTVTLNNDIPIESVSKMLGHSSIAMTQNYARLLDKKVSQDMSKLFDKFSNEKAKVPIEINPN